MERLAVSLLGKISDLAITQSGSFFLQSMVVLLASHFPASEVLALINDEIIQGLDQVSPQSLLQIVFVFGSHYCSHFFGNWNFP